MKKIINILFFNIPLKVFLIIALGINFVFISPQVRNPKVSFPIENCVAVVDMMECTR